MGTVGLTVGKLKKKAENCDLLEVYYQDVKWLKKMKTNHGLLLNIWTG